MKTQTKLFQELISNKVSYINGKLFTKEHLNSIVEKTEVVHCKNKESVTDILDKEYIYIIIEGAFRYYVIQDEQEERVLRFSYPGDILFSCDTLSKDKTQIKAINQCSLLKVKIDDLYPSTTEKNDFIISLSEKARKRIMEEVYISTLNVEERYIKMLNEHKDIIYNIPSKYIASNLNIIESSFCRIKKRVLFSK